MYQFRMVGEFVRSGGNSYCKLKTSLYNPKKGNFRLVACYVVLNYLCCGLAKYVFPIYTMHNKFSNFLCIASFFVLIFVQCRSISIAMTRTGS